MFPGRISRSPDWQSRMKPGIPPQPSVEGTEESQAGLLGRPREWKPQLPWVSLRHCFWKAAILANKADLTCV